MNSYRTSTIKTCCAGTKLMIRTTSFRTNRSLSFTLVAANRENHSTLLFSVLAVTKSPSALDGSSPTSARSLARNPGVFGNIVKHMRISSCIAIVRSHYICYGVAGQHLLNYPFNQVLYSTRRELRE